VGCLKEEARPLDSWQTRLIFQGLARREAIAFRLPGFARVFTGKFVARSRADGSRQNTI